VILFLTILTDNVRLKPFFVKKNPGCKYAVSSAITWFFENEENGIILEDDCLPNQSFFGFVRNYLGDKDKIETRTDKS
jgi:homospermidine synthase